MPMEPKFKNSELIHLLDIANQRLRHIHDALWKEETHYTWLSYILAGGLIYILVVIAQNKFNLLITIGFFLAAVTLSIVGMLVCIMGFKVIRLEGTYFYTAIEIRNRLHRALELHKYHVENKRIFPDDELESPKDWDKVKKDANKYPKQLLNCETLKQLLSLKEPENQPSRYSIRDLFQLTMLLPMIIFCLAIPYSIISFIFYCTSMN